MPVLQTSGTSGNAGFINDSLDCVWPNGKMPRPSAKHRNSCKRNVKEVNHVADLTNELPRIRLILYAIMQYPPCAFEMHGAYVQRAL